MKEKANGDRGRLSVQHTRAEDYVLVEAGGVLFVVDIFSPGFGPPPPELEVDNDIDIDIDWVAGGHGGVVAWDELVPTG